MVTQSEINKYIKNIKKELLYGTRETKQFLKELKQNIADYVEENQVADMEQIMEQFGKPEDIAATFFEQYRKEDIKKKINIRRVIAAAIAITIIIFAVTIIVVIVDSSTANIDRIVAGEETTLSANINSTDIQT